MGNAPSSDGKIPSYDGNVPKPPPIYLDDSVSSTVNIPQNPLSFAQLITQPTFTQLITQPTTQLVTQPTTPPPTSTTVDEVKTEKKDNFFIKFLEDNKLIIPLAVVGVATVGMAAYSLSKK